ncbi:MAG TPA: GNAT family N-acetyltransferase [Verrucomicrobiae bacterium]|nr:GNAT family N-acetyltransferase [Verrucomicrobiae bacterium]
MQPLAKLVPAQDVLPLRTRHRQEMNCQIVHDSIHRREGWTLIYQLELQGEAVGFGTVAIGGPWKDKPTVLEYYVLPEHRLRAFELFEVFLAAGTPGFFEIQSNDVLPMVMLHTYGRDIMSEKIVFRDGFTTTHPSGGAMMRRVTSEEDVKNHLERRQGSSDWILEMDGQPVGKGGVAFHYNRPYADVYMEVAEPFRRRGLGSYLVQELKRVCYDLGAVPGARCNVGNIASRRTLQRAGFVPYAHILLGTIPR